MFALVERHVGDFAEAGAVVVQRANMAPVHIAGALAEVVSTEGGQPHEHGVDISLGGDKRVHRGVVSLAHGISPELASRSMLLANASVASRSRN